MFPAADPLICDASRCDPPPGLRVRNFESSIVPVFKGTPRKDRVTEIILHETVTRDVKTTIAVLSRRRLGVHFIVAPDGEVTQHAGPARTRLEHAAPHNRRSVGIEIVNPVEVRFMKRGLPWDRYITAPWAVGGRYVLPTPAQIEAATLLVQWLTSPAASGLQIPRTWIGCDGNALTMGRVAGAATAEPGINAHSAFHHADGAWPMLYAYLRVELGVPADEAYERACELAKSQKPRVSASISSQPERPNAQRGTPWNLN